MYKLKKGVVYAELVLRNNTVNDLGRYKGLTKLAPTVKDVCTEILIIIKNLHVKEQGHRGHHSV